MRKFSASTVTSRETRYIFRMNQDIPRIVEWLMQAVATPEVPSLTVTGSCNDSDMKMKFVKGTISWVSIQILYRTSSKQKRTARLWFPATFSSYSFRDESKVVITDRDLIQEKIRQICEDTVLDTVTFQIMFTNTQLELGDKNFIVPLRMQLSNLILADDHGPLLTSGSKGSKRSSSACITCSQDTSVSLFCILKG